MVGDTVTNNGLGKSGSLGDLSSALRQPGSEVESSPQPKAA